MAANLRRLTEAIQESSSDRKLKSKIEASKDVILKTLKVDGKYDIKDGKGHTYRIESTKKEA